MTFTLSVIGKYKYENKNKYYSMVIRNLELNSLPSFLIFSKMKRTQQ